jgi:uncharacterized protein
MSAELTEARLSDRLSPEALRHLMEFKREVDTALPGQVERMMLFGSRARGDAEEDSDYDVAVFLRDYEGDFAVLSLLSDLSYRHMLEGFDINPIDLPHDYLHSPRGRTALAEDIDRDGIILP